MKAAYYNHYERVNGMISLSNLKATQMKCVDQTKPQQFDIEVLEKYEYSRRCIMYMKENGKDVTLKDIAEYIGCSTVTISYYAKKSKKMRVADRIIDIERKYKMMYNVTNDIVTYENLSSREASKICNCGYETLRSKSKDGGYTRTGWKIERIVDETINK